MEVHFCSYCDFAAAGDALCRDDPGGGGGAAGRPANLWPHSGTPTQEPGLQGGADASTGGARWSQLCWYEILTAAAQMQNFQLTHCFPTF